MKIPRTRILLIPLVILLPTAFAVSNPGGVAAAQPAALHASLRQGIEKAFNLEPEAASVIFQKSVELDTARFRKRICRHGRTIPTDPLAPVSTAYGKHASYPHDIVACAPHFVHVTATSSSSVKMWG